MTTAVQESQWTDLLRKPKTILKQVDRYETIRLKRRDGATLRLSLDRSSESVEEGNELAAHLLADAFRQATQSALVEMVEPVIVARYSWSRFLPEEDRHAFVRELVETVEACASVGNNSKLSEVLHAWESTAKIHADPTLAAELKRPKPGTDIKVPRPPKR